MQNYYGFNPYMQQQRGGNQGLRIFPVSNILEANATPVENLDPVFFYNRAENVIYKKQIDGTGAAPIQVFKLQLAQEPISEVKTAESINTYEKDFKAINDRLDELKNLLIPQEEIKPKKAGKNVE